MTFIKLHRDGEPIWVNAQTIEVILKAETPNRNARIVFSGIENDYIEVKETPGLILDLISQG